MVSGRKNLNFGLSDGKYDFYKCHHCVSSLKCCLAAPNFLKATQAELRVYSRDIIRIAYSKVAVCNSVGSEEVKFGQNSSS